MDEDYPEGCLHGDWLEKAGLIDQEDDVESYGRTEDAGDAKDETKVVEGAKGDGDSKE